MDGDEVIFDQKSQLKLISTKKHSAFTERAKSVLIHHTIKTTTPTKELDRKGSISSLASVKEGGERDSIAKR